MPGEVPAATWKLTELVQFGRMVWLRVQFGGSPSCKPRARLSQFVPIPSACHFCALDLIQFVFEDRGLFHIC